MREQPIIFVDTIPAAKRAAAAHTGARLVTDNPMLAYDPRLPSPVEDISRHLAQPEATKLGHAAIDSLLALDQRLAATGAAQRFGGLPGRLNVTLPLRALLATLVQRGTMISRALADHGPGPLVLMAVDAPRWDAGYPWTLPRYACPYRPLAERGFFGNRPARFEAVTVDLPDKFNDTAIDDPLLRAGLVPSIMLLFEAAQRIGIDRVGWKNGIAVGKPAETLREAMPWLALRGYRLGRFVVPAYAGETPPAFGMQSVADSRFGAADRALIYERIQASGALSEIEAKAITDVLMDHLAAGLRSLEQTLRALEAALDLAFRGAGDKKTLITSGYYGPLAGQLQALCAQRQITLIDFEHGATTGLAHTSERRLAVSEATTCDVLMVSSGAAARSFARARTDSVPRIEIVGLADQTRRVFNRRLQRWRARGRLGLRRGECAVMHVSTLPFGGNMRPGDDSPIESFVFETERRLLTEVYARIGKTVLFKPYPAQRFPHHADYSDLFSLPANVRLIEWADFRYIRAAADVIVTTANSSTIGWCAGAGVPLVHLGSKIVHALADDALRRRFADSFFAVDLDDDDWSDHLIELLSREPAQIERVWRSKESSRRGLVQEAIVGPPGSVGRHAASLVAKLHA